MAGERRQRLTGAVPQASRPVPSTGGQGGPIGTEHHARDPACMASQTVAFPHTIKSPD